MGVVLKHNNQIYESHMKSHKCTRFFVEEQFDKYVNMHVLVSGILLLSFKHDIANGRVIQT